MANQKRCTDNQHKMLSETIVVKQNIKLKLNNS